MSRNRKFKDALVPKSVKKLLKGATVNCYSSLVKGNATIAVQLDQKLATLRLLKIKQILKNKKHPKVLDLGCGAGYLVTFLNLNGVKARGIEPDQYSFKASQELLKANKLEKSRISNTVGEKLTFKNKFDIIVSYQVIEHTQDPAKVFQKCFQALKPGGHIYFVIPNYHSFWEGHYGIFWFPFLNKKNAKIYVKLFGKDPKFIDTLQFITPSKVRTYLKLAGFKSISLGEKVFNKRMKNAKFMSFGHTSKILKPLLLLKKLKLNQLIAKICLKTDTFYPIIVLAQKPK